MTLVSAWIFGAIYMRIYENYENLEFENFCYFPTAVAERNQWEGIWTIL